MGTRERTAGRFQVESLEGRWAPGGLAGGVVAGGGSGHVAGEIAQVQAAPRASEPGGGGAPTPFSIKPGQGDF